MILRRQKKLITIYYFKVDNIPVNLLKPLRRLANKHSIVIDFMDLGTCREYEFYTFNYSALINFETDLKNLIPQIKLQQDD